jgi:peptide chain release factor subunit 1
MGFEDSINKLSGYANDTYPVTSLYLKLGPRDRGNFRYTIKLKNLEKNLRDKIGTSGLSKAALESVESDLARIRSLVDSGSDLSECRGIAIFSCSKDGLWEVLKLPSVYRNQLEIDRSPVIGQLIKVHDEYSRIVTVLVDRKKARIFSIDIDGPKEILDYFDPAAERSTKFHNPQGKYAKKTAPATAGRSPGQGFGEFNFNRMVENEIQRHFKYVAQKLNDYYRAENFRWLILGGTEENISEFSHYLHTDLRNKIAGSVSIDFERTKPSLVMDVSLDVLEAARVERQKKLIDEFAGKLPVGYAVDGLKATLDALRNAQARVLLVEKGFSQPGFVCPESEVYLTDASEKCPDGEEPAPVNDLIDCAIDEAFDQGAEVEIIPDEPYKKHVHGMGAILRFKV